MRVIIFVCFFICFQTVLLSQTNNVPGTRNAGNAIFNGSRLIATSYTNSACGLNYTYASNPLYGRTGNNFTLSVAQPASFSITGIPPCAVIEKAFLYVGTSGSGVGISASITNPLTSNLIVPLAIVGSGPDKNWGFAGSYTYRGDATAIISGNGSYIISGIPTGTALAGNDANGALLLVIYSDRTQGYTGNIVIADGSFVNDTLNGSVNNPISGFSTCGTPSLTTNFMLIDDQQKYDTTLIALNSAVPNYTLPPASQNPWQFVTDPGAAAVASQTNALYGLSNHKDTVCLLMAGMYYQSSCLTCGALSFTASSTASCLSTGTVVVAHGVAPLSYTWSGSAQTGSVVTGLSAGIQTITVRDSLGCLTGSVTMLITTPAPSLAVTSGTICIGFSSTLTAGPAASYTWSPAASLDNPASPTVVASPLASTIYSVSYTNTLGCVGTVTTQVTVTPTQTFAISGSTTCSGKGFTLSTGSFTGNGYSWTGPNAFGAIQQDTVFTNASTGLSGVYNVSVTNLPGCISTSSCTVSISNAPAISVSAGSLCIGFSTSLTAGAAASYTWNPAASINAPNAQTVTASPLATTIYTVDFTDASGCTGSSTTQVIVTHTQGISGNSSTLCASQNLALSTNGFLGNAYIWTGPGGFFSSNQTPVVTNATTTMSGVYNLSVTSIPGCTSTAVSNITVFPTPSPSITSNAPICSGFNLNLSGNNGQTYAWTGPNGFTSSTQFPTITNAGVNATGIYTLTATFLTGCNATVTKLLVVQPLPVPSINTTTNVCVGRPVTFSASPSGFPIYQWAGPNSFTSNLQVASIASITLLGNGVYTLTVKDANNCQASATTTMAAIVNPIVSATGTTVCFGSPATLTANGVGFFTWLGPNGYSTTPAVPTTSIAVVNNLSVGIYTVILTSASTSCSAQSTTTLLTIPVPTVVATGTNVCLNEPATLTVTGAPSYSWSGPNSYAATGPNPVVSIANALSTGIYTVIGTAANTCTGSSTASIGTIPLPTVTATGSLTCLNAPFTFTANGAQTYSWSGPTSYTAVGSTAFVPVTYNLTTGIYTVVGRAPNTCTNVTTAALSSIPLPTVTSVGQTVCLNSPATLTASGATTYQWTGPGGYSNTGPTAFIPAATSALPQTYTVIGTAPTTCSNISTTTLITLPLPYISATGTLICFGEPFTIAATGGTNYAWSGPNSYTANGPGGAFIPVSDYVSAGIYSVIATAANSCTGSATAALGTLPLPIVNATGTVICLNEPFTLTAGGAQNYFWRGPSSYTAAGSTAYVPNVNALSAGIYTVLGTAANTCTSIATTTLGTIPLPVITTTGQTVCLNSAATLAAGGAATYSWTGPGSYNGTGPTAFIPAASSVAAQIYTVLGMAATSCTNTGTASLQTIPLPTVNATGTVICFNEPFTMVASGAATYTWTGPNYSGNGPSAFIPHVNVASSGVYSIIATAATGCTDAATTSLSTLPLPIITTTGTTVCFLQPATLMAGGGISTGYSWTGQGSYAAATSSAYIATATSHQPQTYTVVGTGLNTCTNIATATLSTYYLPTPGFTLPASACFKTNVSIHAFGASTYTWTGPRHYLWPHQDASFPIFNMGQAGTYTLSVTDSLGCKNDTTALLHLNPLPEGVLKTDHTNFCVPFCADYKLQRTSVSPIVSSTWTINDNIVNTESFNYCAFKAGADTISCTFSDMEGCVNTMRFVIDAYPVPVADFSYYPEKPVANTDQVIFTSRSSGQELTAWNWYFVSNNGYVSSGQNTFYTFEDAGNNQIAMVVTNTWGCMDTVVKTIAVASDVRIYVPNVFTPNSDGLNDTFRPQGAGFTKYSMVIYNRWGEELFQTSNFDTGWDGKLRGENCKDDVYTWKIHTVNINGLAEELSGSVTLVR